MANDGDEHGHDDDPLARPDPFDTGETRSMQAQIVAEGMSGGLLGMAAGAAVAIGATVWLRLRRRR